MSNVTDLRLYLPPSTLKGFPVDVVPADPALGGYDILIWRSAAHDDGLRVHRLPQAQRIIQTFRPQDVAVIGLHCVFEHHAAQGPVSLAAFLHNTVSAFRSLWTWRSQTVPCRRPWPVMGWRGRQPCCWLTARGDCVHAISDRFPILHWGPR